MTRAEFLKLQARAAANSKPARARKAPEPELNLGDGPLAAQEGEGDDTARFLVRVTAVRTRLLDEDNLFPKYHIDCLRYAGQLHDDCPAEAHIETRQRKAQKGEEEHVIIEMFAINQSNGTP